MPTPDPKPSPTTTLERLQTENEQLNNTLIDLGTRSTARIEQLEGELKHWQEATFAAQQQAASLAAIVESEGSYLVSIGDATFLGFFTPASIRTVTRESGRVYVDGYTVAAEIDERMPGETMMQIVEQVNTAKADLARRAQEERDEREEEKEQKRQATQAERDAERAARETRRKQQWEEREAKKQEERQIQDKKRAEAAAAKKAEDERKEATKALKQAAKTPTPKPPQASETAAEPPTGVEDPPAPEEP